MRYEQEARATFESGRDTGGKEIKKEGKVTIHWTTGSGVSKKGLFTMNHPHIINVNTGEVMPLRKNRGMFIFDMWMWIPTIQSKIGECSDFVRQEYIDSTIPPQVQFKNQRTQKESASSWDNDILTLNVDCGALGEEMESEAEDQAEQDADKVRTISDPGQPSKREREEHEATHAQYRSCCIAYVRCRGVAMKHFRNTFADEKNDCTRM